MLLVYASLFFWIPESHHLLPLNLRFFLFFFFSSPSLAFLFEMARTKTTPNPPPSIDYKSLYRWALDSLLGETSQTISFKDIKAYMEGESDEKYRIFGREHDRFVKVLPCKEGKPVCIDDRADPEDPFFFMYSTTFKRLKLRLPFTGIERASQQLGIRQGLFHPLQPLWLMANS